MSSAVGRLRCGWANGDELLARYHDDEWGTPPATDDACFEALTLEIFQAGLSWRTILHKRDGFRQAFAGFSIAAVADFDEHDVERLLADAAIVRHRQKIVSTIANARAVRELQRESGPFRDWLDALPPDLEPAYRTLRPRLKFFGVTTCESFLHAIGKLPAPHDPGCWKAPASE